MHLKRMAALLLILAALILPRSVLADVGNFNDSSDSGSGGWDSGSSNSDSWGSDDDSDWSFSWNSDSSSGWSTGSHSSRGTSTISSWVIVLVIVLVVRANQKKNRSGGSRNGARGGRGFDAGSRMQTGLGPEPFGGYPPVPSMDDASISSAVAASIHAVDPAFSESVFLPWVEQTFLALQAAWTQRDWEAVRAIETESLFRRHQAQLDEYIRNRTVNVVERICINRSWLVSFRTEADRQILVVHLDARMNDYVVDENTRQVVRGNPDQVFHGIYALTFVRAAGLQSGTAEGGAVAVRCPNCGAPLAMNAFGKCEYCGTAARTDQHVWALADLDRLQNLT